MSHLISSTVSKHQRKSNMKRLTLMAASFALSLSLPLQASFTEALSPEDKGLQIAIETDRRDAGFKDSAATVTMTLRDKNGKESLRKIRIKTMEIPGDGDKSLTIFDNPRDIKGTAFLSYTHKAGDDDQWIYLPALKRVKRISSGNKSGSFMGSEFSYEDIASQEVEKYTYKWIRDEVYDGHDSFVIEQYPVDSKNSGYRRQVVWIDKKEYRLLKVEYYDRTNSLLKILTLTEFRQYKGRFWRPDEMLMVNLRTGKSTNLQYADYRFGIGLEDKDFTHLSLKRAK